LICTDKPRLEMLGGLAPHTLNGMMILQSRPCFTPTPYGANAQTSEELIPFNEEYIILRARTDAPRWLTTGCDLWQLSQLWTHQAGSAGSMIGPVGCLPAPQVPLRLWQMEVALGDRPGPLDLFVDEGTLYQKRSNRESNRLRQVLEMQQGPGGENRGGVNPAQPVNK
jgi:hypothetical protein